MQIPGVLMHASDWGLADFVVQGLLLAASPLLLAQRLIHSFIHSFIQVPGVLVAVLSSSDQGVRDPTWRSLVIVANSRPSMFTLDWPAGMPHCNDTWGQTPRQSCVPK